jgi:hypothetical protein
MNLVSVSYKLKERSFQYKMLPRSLPNSERKIIALLPFLNFDAFTPCIAPERQGGSQKEIHLGALRVADMKNMNSVALERQARHYFDYALERTSQNSASV